MTRKTLVRIIVVTFIAAVLGGASLIIIHNGQSSITDTPSGFFH